MDFMKKFKPLLVLLLLLLCVFLPSTLRAKADFKTYSYTFNSPITASQMTNLRTTLNGGYTYFQGYFYYNLNISYDDFVTNTIFLDDNGIVNGYEDVKDEYNLPYNKSSVFNLLAFLYIFMDSTGIIYVGAENLFGVDWADYVAFYPIVKADGSFFNSYFRYMKLNFYQPNLQSWLNVVGVFDLVLPVTEPSDFSDLLESILDIPPQMIKSYFSFEIFGNVMYLVIFGFMSVLLVVWAIKKLL